MLRVLCFAALQIADDLPLVPLILGRVGPGAILSWTQHFLALGLYTALDRLAERCAILGGSGQVMEGRMWGPGGGGSTWVGRGQERGACVPVWRRGPA